MARVAAGAFGFLIFSHVFDGPDLYGALSFFETMPSRPSFTKNWARHSGFNKRDVSGSAFAPRVQRRSTGSDCKSLCCQPKYCLCGSSRRTSDTGSPKKRYLGRARSPRTTEPGRSPRNLDCSLPTQEQRQSPKSCVSSSFNFYAGVSNNTKEAVAISICRGRLSLAN
jgi:hypothetical protein